MTENESGQPVPETKSGAVQEGVPVCPKCLRPCNPQDYYCPYCGSNEAINPLTPYISFVNIRFNVGIFGKLWNRCFYEKGIAWWMRILYFLFLLLWLPLGVIGLPFVFLEKIKDDHKRGLYERAYLCCLVFLMVGVLFVLFYFTWREVRKV